MTVISDLFDNDAGATQGVLIREVSAAVATVWPMGLSDLTREAVLAAMAEHDRLGRDRFLATYGFGEARSYKVEANGTTYDSKAIAGAAHGYLSGRDRLRADKFSGGEATVARRLRQLGFVVPPTRAPAWVRDELILACDLVMTNSWNECRVGDPRVTELSEVLQRLPIHGPELRSSDFRNPNSVSRKTTDIATHHPAYTGKTTRGGKTDIEVLKDFLESPNEMHQAALALHEAANEGEFVDWYPLPPDSADESSTKEGRILERRHYVRERNPALRTQKIAEFLKTHDRVICEMCEFDFEATYGSRGANYIECHHVTPLHISGETETKLADLILLCANCHRMIHRGTPWFTPSQLRAVLR